MHLIAQFVVMNLVQEDYLPLDRARLGKQTASAIASALHSVCGALSPSSAFTVESGFSTAAGELRFSTSSRDHILIDAAALVAAATNALTALFEAANAIGEMRRRGIEPTIAHVQSATFEVAVTENKVTVLAPRPLDGALTKLLRFLDVMGFSESGIATVRVGNETMEVAVSKPPRQEAETVAREMVGTVVGASDKSKVIEFHASEGKRKMFRLSFAMEHRESLAEAYRFERNVRLSATLTTSQQGKRKTHGTVDGVTFVKADADESALTHGQNRSLEFGTPSKSKRRGPTGRARR